MKIIHITDTHIVSAGNTLYATNPAKRLELAVDSINKEHADASMVIFTGDVTDVGDKGAYEVFKSQVDRLTMPYHVIVGNHDITPAFSEILFNIPRDENGFVQYTLDTPIGTFILCDTLSGLHFDGHHGRYCENRCAWLNTQLRNADGDVYMFMHHPPMDLGIPWMDAIKMWDEQALLDTISPYKHKVKHMFFGHVHRSVSGIWNDIPFSIMRGTNHQVALVMQEQHGTALNFENPAYGVVLFQDNLLGGKNVVSHHYSYADRSPHICRLGFTETDEEREINALKCMKEHYPDWRDY